MHSIWASSPDDIYITAKFGTLHFDGEDWTSLSFAELLLLYAVAGTSSNDVWIEDKFHFDGQVWKDHMLGKDFAPQGSGSMMDMWVLSNGKIYGTHFNYFRRFDGQHWTIEKPFQVNMNAVWAEDEKTIYVVGEGGAVSSFDGEEWTVHDVGTTADLTGIWGSSGSDIYVVGTFKDSKKGTIIHYNGAEWKVLSDTLPSMEDVHGNGGEVFACGDEVAFKLSGDSYQLLREFPNVHLSEVYLTGPRLVLAGKKHDEDSFSSEVFFHRW